MTPMSVSSLVWECAVRRSMPTASWSVLLLTMPAEFRA